MRKGPDVIARRRVPEGLGSAQVAPHPADVAREGGEEAVLHVVGRELKDDAVGRIEAAVERHEHAHVDEIARQAHDIARLPRALKCLRFGVPLHLSDAVYRPRSAVVPNPILCR